MNIRIKIDAGFNPADYLDYDLNIISTDTHHLIFGINEMTKFEFMAKYDAEGLKPTSVFYVEGSYAENVRNMIKSHNNPSPFAGNFPSLQSIAAMNQQYMAQQAQAQSSYNQYTASQQGFMPIYQTSKLLGGI